ncbi:MAG: hypothetical protein WC966_01490, partial [Bradymonadales bacterium]
MMFFRFKILGLPLLCLCACLLSACDSDGDIAKFTGERCPPVSDGAEQPKNIMSERCQKNPEACHYHSEIGRCEADYKCVPDPTEGVSSSLCKLTFTYSFLTPSHPGCKISSCPLIVA